MRNWREIRSDIYDALSDYDVDVCYHGPRGHGYEASCAYFTVTIDDDEEWDWDDLDEALEDVCSEWDLSIDDDSEGTFDLNAYWDCND